MLRLRWILVMFVPTMVFSQTVPRVLPPPVEDFLSNRPANLPTSTYAAEYRIGRDDLIEITVFEVPELTSSIRVSGAGMLSLPVIGVVEASGKTAQQLEKAIEQALRVKYVNDPHVTVFIREYASQPVSIIGAVKLPGIYPMKGEKSLLDMLATAQGLDAGAGKEIQIIRRAESPNGPRPAITIDAEELFQNGRTELNIPIQAGDVINVLRAGSVFVVGEIVQSGEFPLRNGKNITVSQAVALGRGFTKEAKKKQCVIIRFHKDGSKQEIPVNIEKIFDGSANDVSLLTDDILFVPSNKVKAGFLRGLDAAIGIVTGRLIYRF